MYKVGTRVLSFKDETRTEKLGPGEGPRYVGARLYYPASLKDEEKVEIEGKALGEMYDSPAFCDGRFPVLVYNHGYGAYVECNNLLCCQLAAKGYLVVAIGHAYECDGVVLDDGSKLLLDPKIRKLQVYPKFMGTIEALKVKGVKGELSKQAAAFGAYQKKYCSFLMGRLKEWALDVEFAMAQIESLYKDYIKEGSDYVILGHSFGGALAYYMCQHYDKYCKGINMDGAIFGDYDGMTMTKPFLQIISRGNVAVTSRAMLNSVAPVACEIIDGAAHLSFVDLKFYKEKAFMMGKISHDEISDKVYDLVSTFIER